MLGGKFDRTRITGVGVTKDTHSRIASEHALEAALRIFAAIGNSDHTGVLRKTDANAAAVVDRNPGCASGGVDQRVEQRPIGDRVAAIEHSFRFAIGRCDRAGIEMIASNHNRRFDFAALHQLVYRHAEFGAIAVTEPANARGQS